MPTDLVAGQSNSRQGNHARPLNMVRDQLDLLTLRQIIDTVKLIAFFSAACVLCLLFACVFVRCVGGE
eukprot:SAG11_NODE_26054_length_350_cov_1.035857_1_plen_67_part_01